MTSRYAWMALGAVLCAGVSVVGCNDRPCLTVLDLCRAGPDGGITEPVPVDANFAKVDGGPDAGFAACVNAECQEECATVNEPRLVCLVPACSQCQEVFCGYLFSCGRDAAMPPPDAAVRDSGNLDSGNLDSGNHVDGAALDASVPDATAPDAAITDAAQSLDVGVVDAAPSDAT